MPSNNETPKPEVTATEENDESVSTTTTETSEEDGKSSTEETATPSPNTPAGNDNDTIKRSEVDALIKDAVQKALQANAAKQVEDARIKAAAENGNYKELWEESERLRKVSDLNLWRGQALAAHKLSDEWFDSLTGDDKDKIFESAKALKKRLDAAIEAEKKAFTTEHVGTPPPIGRGSQRGKEQENDGKIRAATTLAGAFGVNNKNAVTSSR